MGVVGLWYTAPAPPPSDVELYHFR